MPVTTPPTITALPTPPDPNDRSTFNTRAYPWSVAQQTLATEVEAVAANVFANATEAAAAVAQAVPAAAAAQAASNATQWVSGTTYTAGAVVWSPINALSYRRRTTGAGTIDPSADPTNWAALAAGGAKIERSARTSNTALAAADAGTLIDITSGTFTQTFDACAALGNGWYCYLRNSGAGDITLDPSGSEQIDGLTNYVMYPGEVRLVQCDGAALRTILIAGDQILVVRDERASGTAGGDSSAGSWIQRTLNTVQRNSISGASLASSRITLPAGRYKVNASAPSRTAGAHKVRLFNVTAAAVLAVGTSDDSGSSEFKISRSYCNACFALSATSEIRLDHYVSFAVTNGYGTPASTGAVEVYAEVIIERLA